MLEDMRLWNKWDEDFVLWKKKFCPFFATAKGRKDVEVHEGTSFTWKKVIDAVGLSSSIDLKVKGFSRGMKQRLGLATTIISQPKLILLDEPCSALDPIGRYDVLEIVSELKQNSTVLFSTHILSDVETVCDSVTVVDHGKTLYEGTVSGISDGKKSFEDAVIELLRPKKEL